MGGYDAGYYGYLWSKVYGDDMFGRFEAEGVTSPVVGAEYRREILEPNGTRDGMDMLRAFLGRDPSPATFLAPAGHRGAGARLRARAGALSARYSALTALTRSARPAFASAKSIPVLGFT